MRHVFKFPDIGEGLEEGTIVEWYVKKGQEVESGQSLVQVETDKVTTDIPSPKTGTIAALYGKEGETINVGDPLAEIEIEGVEGEEAVEEAKKEPAGPSEEGVEEEEGAGVVGTIEVAGDGGHLPSSEEGMDATQKSTEEEKPRKKALATPVARALAKDLGVDINEIKGTGPGGRVMKEDIHNYVDKQGKQPSKAAPKEVQEQTVEYEDLTQIRKTIAKNMVQSKHNAAHMTVMDEVEISELVRVRGKYKEKYKDQGLKLNYLPFILKATALALKKHRQLNAEMDMDNSRMIYKKYYNIGIAVDTEKGLVVPVIKNVDKLSISELAEKTNEIAKKARDGELTMDDMKDGTFTITSYGSIGGQFAVPVINYPQAGILGIGRILKKPVVNDKDEIVPGQILPLSLSVDHRIVDGGEVSRFLNTIIEYLGEPVNLIMD
jgi:pyruvate dehydrogenase E2 component (dihydrolipoamide acetyltransferase)